MGKSFVREHLILIVLFAIQLAMQINTVSRWPSRTLATPLSFGNVCMISILILLFAINLAAYWIWIRRAEDAVREGLPCPSSSFYRGFRYALWLFVAVYLALLLLSAELWLVAGALAVAVICFLTTRLVMELCKKLNCPKWVNITVPIVVSFLVTMGLLTGLFHMADDLSLGVSETPDVPAPLSIADLTDSQGEARVAEYTASPAAAYARYVDDDSGDLELSYLVVDVKMGIFYDMCLNEQEQDFLQTAAIFSNGEITISQASALWDAEYVRHAPGDFNDRWLVCWDGRIVSLSASWHLTDEQIQTAAALLKP